MYLTPWAAVALFLLAAVGALALVTSVGVWIFTSGLPEGDADDAPVAPSNVRVIDRYQHDLGPACALCGRDHGPAPWIADDSTGRRVMIHALCGEAHDRAATCRDAS